MNNLYVTYKGQFCVRGIKQSGKGRSSGTYTDCFIDNDTIDSMSVIKNVHAAAESDCPFDLSHFYSNISLLQLVK